MLELLKGLLKELPKLHGESIMMHTSKSKDFARKELNT